MTSETVHKLLGTPDPFGLEASYALRKQCRLAGLVPHRKPKR